VEKYRPEKLEDIAGNPKAVRLLVDWMEKWKEGRHKKKSVLLHGPAGVGKTSAAYALARELNSDYIELNASDFRTRDVINRVVGSASKSGLLDDYSGRIIIVDEVDGIHGKADYGGLSALMKLIQATSHPIVMIANDPYRLSKEFRALTEMVEFRKIKERTVQHVLKEVAGEEGIKASDKVLKVIAANSGGDLRAALNDFQAVSQGREEVNLSDVEILYMRDSEINIFNVLARILKTDSIDRAREALRESQEDPETVFKWLVENVPLEYKEGDDLARAMNYLSRADVFLGRVRRRQDWTLMKYSLDLMSAGVASAKKKKYKGFTRYSYPQTFVLMARTKKSRKENLNLARKIQGKEGYTNRVHSSVREIRQNFLPMVEVIMENNREMGARLASELELDEEDLKTLVREEKGKKIFQLSQEITRERLKAQMKGDSSKQASLFEY